jgi:signal transduction histidine kinase
MGYPDWLLLLGQAGTIEAVDGGAPAGWVGRRVDECGGLPEGVKHCARRLVRDLAEPQASRRARRVVVEPQTPGAPSFTLLAVEAIFLRPEEVEIEPLLRKALDPLARQAEALGVSLSVETEPELPARAAIDPIKIVWAVTTLVGSALRYLRRGSAKLPGGHVGVALSHNAAQRMLSITVEDDGPGISAEVHARLLQPDGGEATGVSLRLVHEVVVADGGGMVIKSSTAPEDRGTTVTLWLPVRG